MLTYQFTTKYPLQAWVNKGERKVWNKNSQNRIDTMAAVGSDGTVCSLTSQCDVCTQDVNVFFNELKGVFKKNSKYFVTYDVSFFV